MINYDLKVGYSCNNKCKHCVIDDSKDRLIKEKIKYDLTTEECFQQINEAVNRNIHNIILTGGEITIRKDFIDILKECVKHNLNISVQTNGRRLNDKILLDYIKKIDNIKFIVAVHGASEFIHDHITQVKGSFLETCNGIKSIIDINKQVVIKVVISKLNMVDLPKIVDLVNELGGKYICFAFPHGQGAARKNFDTVIPKYLELKPYLEELIFRAKKDNIYIEFEAIPFCIIPTNMKLVGELKYFKDNTFCTQVKEETFDWDNIRKSIKKKSHKCSICDMNRFCEGVWSEYIDAFGEDEFTPISIPLNKKDMFFKALEEYSSKC